MLESHRLLSQGTKAQAIVLFVHMKHGPGSDESRSFDYVLEVQPDSGESFRAELEHHARAVALTPERGERVRVLYDPESREVIFDLDGDPRYDLEARARLTEGERAALLADAPVPAPPDGEPLERLERLGRLHAAGVLTDAEFDEQKRRTLADD